MQIIVDGTVYEVSPEQAAKLASSFQQMGVEMYQAQNTELRFLLKPLARWILEKWERKLIPLIGKEAAAAQCRPAKKQDPVIHATDFLAVQVGAIAQNANLILTSDGNGNAVDFGLQLKGSTLALEGGGSLDSHGNIGKREDHRAKVS